MLKLKADHHSVQVASPSLNSTSKGTPALWSKSRHEGKRSLLERRVLPVQDARIQCGSQSLFDLIREREGSWRGRWKVELCLVLHGFRIWIVLDTVPVPMESRWIIQRTEAKKCYFILQTPPDSSWFLCARAFCCLQLLFFLFFGFIMAKICVSRII